MARDRYLWNTGEETIHQPEQAASPQTPRGKWENFWYYHKFHLLIALAVVFLLLFLVQDLTVRREPDYQIAVLTQTPLPETVRSVLEQKLTAYGRDLNGDGRVLVSVNAYLMVMEDGKEISDPALQMASVAKLLSDLQEGDSMIFLTDDESFRAHQSTRQLFSNLDGTAPQAGKEDFSAMRVAWNDCKPLSTLVTAGDLTGMDDAAKQSALQQLSGLSASLRLFYSTPLEQKDGKPAYYTASRTLFDRLVYDK